MLFLAIAIAATFGLGIPFSRQTRVGAARKAEEVFPGFQQRLETFVDKEKKGDEPFIDLLASDALDVARTVAPETVAPNTTLMAWLGVGVAAVGALVWLVVAKPGFVGYGAHLLWTTGHGGAAPVTELQVSPGDATVRRNTDQLITAQTPGLLTPQIVLYARYQSAAKWEQVAMQPRSGASGYQFVLTGVPENVEYYVEAGPRRSGTSTSAWWIWPRSSRSRSPTTHPSDGPETPTRTAAAIRALEGTRADLDVVTDRPLTDGSSSPTAASKVRLGGAGITIRVRSRSSRTPARTVAAPIRVRPFVSEDYSSKAASPPQISIATPCRATTARARSKK